MNTIISHTKIRVTMTMTMTTMMKAIYNSYDNSLKNINRY